MSDARIIPVEYSAVIAGTPSAPDDELTECDADQACPERVEAGSLGGVDGGPAAGHSGGEDEGQEDRYRARRQQAPSVAS